MTPRKQRSGKWTSQEHDRFVQAMSMFPNGPWKAVSDFIGTRSTRQTQLHAQKCKDKGIRFKHRPGRTEAQIARSESQQIDHRNLQLLAHQTSGDQTRDINYAFDAALGDHARSIAVQTIDVKSPQCMVPTGVATHSHQFCANQASVIKEYVEALTSGVVEHPRLYATRTADDRMLQCSHSYLSSDQVCFVSEDVRTFSVGAVDNARSIAEQLRVDAALASLFQQPPVRVAPVPFPPTPHSDASTPAAIRSMRCSHVCESPTSMDEFCIDTVDVIDVLADEADDLLLAEILEALSEEPARSLPL